MELYAPCSVYSPLHHRQPPVLHRQLSIPSSFPLRSESVRRCRCKTTLSELNGLSGYSASSSAVSPPPPVPTHKVTVRDRQRGLTHEFLVPEDQYILHTAESRTLGFLLPAGMGMYSGETGKCMGCCTSCAVRIKSGQIKQPEALGISAELKSKGYALLCVGFPSSDVEVETQDEDEVYWLQFGRYFAQGPIERDDYALELATGDE